MGIIFEARELNPDRLVALKMIRSGALASPQEREWFRREAQEASRLEHSNIVTVFHVGEEDEPAYYTMRLMSGTLGRERVDARRAAKLMATIARAVHHGHTRGVLHRDLKPANILIDEARNPHVADFGIATHLDEGDLSPDPLGTPHYMSPEQAGPPPRQLSTKSDVYSLGAILFELLTGRPPFEAETMDAVLELQRSATPPSLRSLDPAMDRDLEAICLACLSKRPEDRPSAERLADELERFLVGEPILSRPLGAGERMARWGKTHPAAAGFAATATWTLIILLIAAVTLRRDQEAERRSDVLNANAYAARSLAELRLLQVGNSVKIVEQLAADPLVVTRLAAPPGEFPTAVEEARRAESFVTIGLLNTAGRAVARSPLPPDPDEYFAMDWGWTDHFKESKRRGEQGRYQAYVGLSSRSEVTGDDKFTISAPVFGSDGGFTGVIYASFPADSVLGHQRGVPDDPRRTTALLARRDNDRLDAGMPRSEGFVILVHDGLSQGKAIAAASTAFKAVPFPDRDAGFDVWTAAPVAADDNYFDPVPGFEGRWLAGFSPVGNTGYVVAVQTRYQVSAGAANDRLGEVGRRAALAMLLGGLSINLLLFFFRRRAAVTSGE